MTFVLSCKITESRDIDCYLAGSCDVTLDTLTLCLSFLAPGAGLIGDGEIMHREGGYVELRLSESSAQSGNFTLTFPAEFGVVNRAWLPISAHLRRPNGTTIEVRTNWRRGASAQVPELPTDREADELALVPPPVRWSPSGSTADLTHIAPVGATLNSEATIVDELALRLCLEQLINLDGTPVNLTDDTTLPTGAYRLDIAQKRIELSAGDANGRRHGLISLLWLREVHSGRIPCGTIEDCPRFGWRGQHLDCARHFYDTESILRLIDLMALLKLNTFHWHFSDDEAFRIHLAAFPELAERTQWRGEGQLLPAVFGGGSGPVGGAYHDTDIQRILDHADKLGVRVLPEIEFPAHALALVRAFPELRDPLDTGEETSVQGYCANVVNPAVPATWDFIRRVVEAVAERFPFGFLHVGGDELPANCWSSSPAVRDLMEQEGLRGPQDVQGWSMAKLADLVRKAGVTPCAWEESTRGNQGGIGHDAVIFSWTGQEAGHRAAAMGHPVVMCPAQHVYLDMAHTGDCDDWGAAWAAFVTLEDTVNWDPVPDGVADGDSGILGVQGAFWSEFTTHCDELDHMIVPRLLGIAAKAWSPKEAVDPGTITRLAGFAQPLLVRSGWLQ